MNCLNHKIQKLLFLVGVNGSGKTYALNEALNEQWNKGLLISEDGLLIVPRQKNRVSVDSETMHYYYINEKERGPNSKPAEWEKISPNAISIISYCNAIKRKLRQFKKKSRGQEKLANIVDILTSCNLNNIEFIYFDEPENFLDEEFLKVVVNLVCALNENGYFVRIATHNPRLLNLMKVGMEQIFFWDNHKSITISREEILSMYISSAEEVEEVRKSNNINVDPGIKFKLGMHNNHRTFNSFIEQSLKNEEFYRCLFCKQIFIVEGQSDIAALSTIKREFDTSAEIFNPSGKAFIPFFSRLFKRLGKNVTVVIDDDLPNSDAVDLSHPVAITKVLERRKKCNEINLVVHSPNLEEHYNIDIDGIGFMLGMSNKVRGKNRGWLKYLAAFVYFSEEENRKKIKTHVLGIRKENNFEFD